ncbi:MAG: thioredoxin [Chloroflexi bacterium]|nr:thioredoxin [Chloroflexota bacterium]
MATQTHKPLELKRSDFDEQVIKSDKPVLVDFYAEWCGPCRVVGPMIEELAAEYDGEVRFAKVNIDDHPDLAVAYGVQSIPTLLFFKQGTPVRRAVGALPKQELRKLLDATLRL